MKIIITILIVLVSISVQAQIVSELTQERKFIESEYLLIDTFSGWSSGNIDTVMFSDVLSKSDLLKFTNNIGLPVIENNDTIYKLKGTYKLDYLRSGKVVKYQRVDKFIMIEVQKSTPLMMLDYLRKRHQLDMGIDNFWNHPKIDELINDL